MAAISFVISFYASGRSLQLVLAVEIIAITRSESPPVGLRSALVIAGAAFMPAPVRAIADQRAQSVAVSAEG